MQTDIDEKCVFKGEVFEVYQSKKKLSNGKYKLTERLQAQDATTVIPTLPDGRVIILNEYHDNNQPYISFPGGRVEENETPEEGAKRELIEETGYSSDDIFMWNQYEPYLKIERHIHILIAKNCYKIAKQKLEEGENIEVKFIEFDELFNFVNNEKFRNRILLIEFLRMEINPEKKAAFKKLLFD